MISFSWPWLFGLLPVPFLLRFVLPEAGSGNDAALRVPYLDDFERGHTSSLQRSLRRWPLFV